MRLDGDGLGIWSMHFIGMLAFHLPIPLAYDVPLTLLSVALAILSSALVLVLVRSRSSTRGSPIRTHGW
jgi:diguanylate cyclase